MTKVYLIPAPLDTETLDVIPPYVFDAIKECELFFVEDQRTTRRYFKSGWKEMVIDNYTWHTLGEPGTQEAFLKALSSNKVMGSSILLALMASGFNGQRFQFVGYLPIEETDRIKAIRLLESTAAKERCTQLFIETPYRNNQLLASLLKHLQDQTLLCVATDLTGKTESIQTRTVAQWRKEIPSLHKRPTLFALYVA